VGRTLVAPVSFGLGDLVVSLPAVQELIRERPDVWLIARATSQRLLAERIAGLGGVIDESGFDPRPGDTLIDLRDHPIQRDYWWGSAEFEAEFGRLDINGILERICRALEIDADFSRPEPLEANPRTDLSDTVVLVRETDGADKRWPATHWATLVSTLQRRGHRVVRVVREPAPSSSSLDDLGVPAVVAPTPGLAVDVLSGCRGVIGVDTGLTHIAVQQLTPTVTICRSSSVYMRQWPHCAVLRAARCTDACLEVEADYAYNDVIDLRDFQPKAKICPSGSPCLAATRPEHAVSLLEELL
jgi:ADP-heptose:LPS heptosyltransferase